LRSGTGCPPTWRLPPLVNESNTVCNDKPKAPAHDQGSQGWEETFSLQRFNVLTPSNLTRLPRIVLRLENLSMQELFHLLGNFCPSLTRVSIDVFSNRFYGPASWITRFQPNINEGLVKCIVETRGKLHHFLIASTKTSLAGC
jgi:hypothetical protein